jgi:hypothetical protein
VIGECGISDDLFLQIRGTWEENNNTYTLTRDVAYRPVLQSCDNPAVGRVLDDDDELPGLIFKSVSPR